MKAVGESGESIDGTEHRIKKYCQVIGWTLLSERERKIESF